MRAAFPDAAALHHQNLNGVLHGFEPMGDHHHRTAFHQLPDAKGDRAVPRQQYAGAGDCQKRGIPQRRPFIFIWPSVKRMRDARKATQGGARR